MNNKEFLEYRDKFVAEALDLSDSKSIEYTISNEDKHYNFKHVASRLGITSQQAMMVYVLKHIDAICNDAKTGKQQSDETVRSRCQDIMNYAILYASLHEEHTKETKNDRNTKSSGTKFSKRGRDKTPSAKPSKWNELQRTK
tara:strand:+ start:222 stop:647 length:426 start_codon:yes stop_codon:yes gene_type:complete